MLKSIHIKNFTVFVNAKIDFNPNLNVIVGENGTGKSHLLKVPYSALAASAEEGRKASGSVPTKGAFQKKLADKIVGVLRPETLGRLARRKRGLSRSEVQFRYKDSAFDLDFSFSTKSESALSIEKLPGEWESKSPVFIPTRELLTIYPGFVAFYENHYLEFEETWRDTCLLLDAPAVRGPKEKNISELLRPLETAMGGKVELDKNGRFYLRVDEQGRMEMPLVAEGLRKLAMLAKLIATGSLLGKNYLFWDEPETNLNPKLIKLIAQSIVHLAQAGIQVFIATHSLFLLRELEILSHDGNNEKKTLIRYIGLQMGDDGVEIEQGNTIEEISIITSLDEELAQSDRYLETESSIDV